MNPSRYHVSSWLKFCFCSLAVIIFDTMIFPNEAYATEMVAASEIDLEDFDGDLDFLSSLPLEKRKQLYVNHRWDDGKSFMHRTKLADLNQLAEEIDDNGAVSSLLLENTGGYLAIDQLVGENTLQRMNARFLNCLVTPSGEWRMTPLMALALMDSREHFAQKLEIFRSNNIDISQQDSFGNTAEGMSTLTVTSLGARRFIDRNLDSSLWQAIIDDKYVHYLNLTRYCHEWYARDFVDFGFKVVLMQTRTDQHRAFLQQDVSTQELRDAANDLWTAFFNVYDSLLDDEEKEKQKEWSLGWRALYVISSLDLQNMDLQEVSINIITRSSSFPHGKKLNDSEEEERTAARALSDVINKLINSRLLNQKEKIPSKVSKITRPSLLNTIVDEETNAITRMFIGKKPYYELDEEEEKNLVMYHLWCTVKAFFSFSVQLDRTFKDGRFFSTEACLDLIDMNLSNSVPTGMSENDRKAMFEGMLSFPPSEY